MYRQTTRSNEAENLKCDNVATSKQTFLTFILWCFCFFQYIYSNCFILEIFAFTNVLKYIAVLSSQSQDVVDFIRLQSIIIALSADASLCFA